MRGDWDHGLGLGWTFRLLPTQGRKRVTSRLVHGIPGMLVGPDIRVEIRISYINRAVAASFPESPVPSMPSISLLQTSVLALAAGFLQLSQANPAVQYSWPLYGGEEYCQSFAKELNLKNTDVQNVTYYPNAQTVTVPLPGADATCSQSADVSVPLCRLSLLVHTSSSSQVKMEIWLPDDWSGRVAAVGNGGLNGCRFYCTFLG
jgi:hypothetical protein